MRTLTVIYLVVAALAGIEIGWIRRRPLEGNKQISMSQGDEASLAEELHDLYPARAIQRHWEARRAISFGRYAHAKKVLQAGLRDAVQHEQMQYDLLRLLIAMDAPQDEIEKVTSEFEFRFPGSKLVPSDQPFKSIYWIAAQKAMKNSQWGQAARAYGALKERGHATGPVFYNLAVALAAANMPDSDIDAAIAEWRKVEPGSKLEDPRSLGRWLSQRDNKAGESIDATPLRR